jgi:hypothetical protein
MTVILALAYARAARVPVNRPVDRQSVGRRLPPFVAVCGRRHAHDIQGALA